MAHYTGPVCRFCRRAGEKLFLKGERCFSPKCAIEKRRRAPGEQMPRRRRQSDRAVQLREKQKLRQTYGVLERQFSNYMADARRQKGVTGQLLLQTLESRLDNVVFRLGFADSRSQARQLVTHGHFNVNDRKTDIPSYLVKAGDAIGWRENSAKNEYFKILKEGGLRRTPPSWLGLDSETMAGRVYSMPDPQEVDTRIDTRLIVEYYSR